MQAFSATLVLHAFEVATLWAIAHTSEGAVGDRAHTPYPKGRKPRAHSDYFFFGFTAFHTM